MTRPAWALSVTDLFTIGIGPSSSHTVGPMRAAVHFAEQAVSYGQPSRVVCKLYGSLALTGKGHATDTAILVGLSGWLPDRIDPEAIAPLVTEIRATQNLKLAGRRLGSPQAPRCLPEGRTRPRPGPELYRQGRSEASGHL